MFDSDPPEILLKLPKTAYEFLKELTKISGPVFIVLDEIGAAFEHDDLNNSQRREKFLSFCTDIIGKWLLLEKVFFVLLGRGSFLSYVGLRPTGISLTPSDYKFERLNIHLIRSKHIIEILKKTRMVENDEKTIEMHFGLNHEQSTQVADNLFLKTNGHPRSLIHALSSCESFLELMNYNQPIDFSDWKLFYDGLFRNKKEVAELLIYMEEGSSDVDLTKECEDAGKKN